MSNLEYAFDIPVNPENKDFVRFPYVPYRNINMNNHLQIDAHVLTIPRCFDIKHGTKNCYAPSYTQYVQNNKK